MFGMIRAASKFPVFRPMHTCSPISRPQIVTPVIIKQKSIKMAQEKSVLQPIVWIDLETTGLEVDKDCILEVACIITDGDLTRQLIGPNIVVSRPFELMNNMNPWCKMQHGKTGLVKDVLSSKISIKDAEQQVLNFVQKHIPQKKVGIMAGSSIHFDKEFIRKEMPLVYEHLHYRLIDVTSVGELVRRWHPKVLVNRPKKMGDHRAMDDIKDSIRELEYYKKSVFKQKEIPK